MKTHPLCFFLVVLVATLTFTSCEKESSDDLNQPLIERMKAVVDSVVEYTNVPGVVALVVDHKRGVDWLYTAGYSDLSKQLPMDPNHLFRIGSNTKTLTGTVLLQLVDEGKLSLNDKLSTYFPDIPKADSITIAMLCNMTSGMYNFTENDNWAQAVITDPTKVWTPQECVDLGVSEPFYFSPGTGWYYSNTNTIILGMLIEKLTGHSLQWEVDERIVKPLRLKNTGLLTSGLTLPGAYPKGYYAGEFEEGADYTDVIDVSWAWAAGSAYSTPRELQLYVEALVGGGLLSDTLQLRRCMDMVNIGPNVAYGLCLLRRGSFYGHNGALPGFTSSMYHSKEKACTVIIYFNCQLELMPDFLFNRFMSILYGEDY
jgi:D-alanyl-D-alanine carboxypeptidase